MRRTWISSAAVAAVALGMLAAAPVEAAGAAASFDPDPLDFGNVQSGSALAFVTATNLASSTRTFADTETALGAGFSVDDNLGPTTPRDDACHYQGPSGPVAVQVAPGGTCRLYYRFDAVSGGSFTAQPKILVADPLTSDSEVDLLLLKASSYAPQPATKGAFTLSPTSLSFGNVDVGQTKTLTTTLKNTSNGNVQVHTAYPADSQYRTAAASTCAQTGGPAVVLVPNATCTIAVTYTPVLSGAATGSASISLSPASGQPGTTEPYESNSRLVTKSLALRGTGVGAKFTIKPASLSFGTVTVDGAKALDVTVRNTSTGPLEFGTTYDALAPFAVVVPTTQSASNCLWGESVGSGFPGDPVTIEQRSQVIAPGGSCAIRVMFDPVATGAVSASIPIDAYGVHTAVGEWDDQGGGLAGGTPLKVSGTGAAATYTVSRSSLPFGKVTVTGRKVLTVTLKNTSTISLQFGSDIASDYIFAPVPSDDPTSCMSEELVPPQDWNDPPGGTLVRHYPAVPAGGSCVLTFAFRPADEGPASFTLPVQVYRSLGTQSADAGILLDTAHVPATGTGIQPTVTFSPSALSFQNVTVSGARSLTVTAKNTSEVPLQIGSDLGTDISPYRLALPTGDTGSNCMRGHFEMGQFPGDPGYWVYEYREIPVGQSCTLTFTFAPHTTGTATAQLPVQLYRSYQTAGFHLQGFLVGSTSVKATGTGIAPTFSFKPAPIAFGTVTVGGTRTVDVTVTNTSDATLQFGSTYGGETAPYRQVVGDHPSGLSCSYDDHQPSQFPGDPGSVDRLFRGVPPGATCTLTFAFTPTKTGAAPAGSFPVQVYESYVSPGAYGFAGTQRATGTIKATGSGAAATFTLSPATLSFGNVRINGSRTLTTVIKNTSASPAQYAVTIPRDSYQVATATDHDPADCILRDDMGQSYVTVAAGASCDLRIEFAPTVAGTDNQTIVVDSYAAINLPGYYSPSPGSQVTGTKKLSVSGRGI